MLHRGHRIWIIGCCLIVSVVGLLSWPVSAPADAVYLKDGYTLYGKVRREATLLIDPVTNLPVPVFKGSNFFVVDDRVRYVIFSHRQVQDADPEVNVRSEFIELDNPFVGSSQTRDMPARAYFAGATDFDKHWQRIAKLRSELGPYDIKQRLTQLSPYSAKVESSTYKWNAYYLTKELGIDAVKRLLSSHPKLQEPNGPDIDVRLKRFRFLMQAGWSVAAQEELDRAAKDLTGNTEVAERIGRARTALEQIQVRDLWGEIQVADRAGRYRRAKEILSRLPIDQLDARSTAAAVALKSKYETWHQQEIDLKRLLDAINYGIAGPPRQAFAEADANIRANAGPDTLERLEPFITMARQYEQECKAKKTPSYSPGSIFALAVTGWVMGREAAEPKIDVAERYWAAREFVLNHQRAHDAGNRKRIFDAYQLQNPLTVDEMSQLIGNLPPIERPEPGKLVANGVEERATQVPWTQNPSVPYLLQLPQEYRPTRHYPVLIALHGSGERPSDILSRWSEEATRNGYILAAPAWGGEGGYNYANSAPEHNPVTELIKDLRRRYSVDSDRIFLTGYGDGGTMAFDVGLSHPDLFAGIVPFNARPAKSSVAWYWTNAQYLPFYIVVGEMAGDIASYNRAPFENWMNKGYGSLMTIYKGRPMELFVCEIPMVFDWMNRKKRASGFPELGRNPYTGPSISEEFRSMRAGDNHFYWVSIENISDKAINREVGSRAGNPATLQAQVRDDNHVHVNSRGIKTLRVWFGRIWDQQNGWRPMIDFSKPVRMTVNRSQGRDRTITPSLQTMLNDLYDRGDRQRMFLAYVELTNLQ